MFVSYKWLEDYVDLQGIDPAMLAEKITRAGIEVEGIEYKGEGVKALSSDTCLSVNSTRMPTNSTNALLISVRRNPCRLSAAPRMLIKDRRLPLQRSEPCFPAISKLKAKLRGEASHGMICSLQELGIESKLVAKEYAEGIFVFPNDAETGADAMAALQLDDAILELGLTPNRADAMNMIGVAYEVAAILGAEVKLPEASYEKRQKKRRMLFPLRLKIRRPIRIMPQKSLKRQNRAVTALDADEADECRHPPA